jgi:hypothetical protein
MPKKKIKPRERRTHTVNVRFNDGEFLELRMYLRSKGIKLKSKFIRDAVMGIIKENVMSSSAS